LIFTPGLAFDRQGNRLGRGKGFYDRFFVVFEGRKFHAEGLCMGIQVVPSVPVEKGDIKVHSVYAESDFKNLLDGL
jgi:5-formyltetrahydrofolate cyclo-ligase